MLESLVSNFGYLGLFVVSFIASSIVPLAVEAFVILTLKNGFSPWLVLLVSTAGGYLWSVTNYYIGKKGGEFLFSKYFKVSHKKIKKAEKLYSKWGSPILFFSWIPFIGDPLTVVAGILKIRFGYFSFWVIFGKAVRFFFLIQAALLIL